MLRRCLSAWRDLTADRKGIRLRRCADDGVALLACLAVVLIHIQALWLSRWSHDLPLLAEFLTLTNKSEVCTFREASEGIRELLHTQKLINRATERSKLVLRDESGQLWETSMGRWWFPKSIEPASVYFSVAQFEINAYKGAPIAKGDVVLDCGGFVGDYAKFAINAGASKVVVVEPSAEALLCIRRNLEPEIQDGRVVVYPKGLWERNDRLFLAVMEETNPAAKSVTNDTSRKGEWIDLTTLDKMVEELGLQRVDVIKMDIEGAEVGAIAGAAKTLSRFRPKLAIATEHTADLLQNNKNEGSRQQRRPVL